MMKKCLAAALAWCCAAALAQDFVAHSDNRPRQLAQGKNVQVLNFWATWCVPCRREMPLLDQWYRSGAKKQRIELIGIALDDADKVSAFLSNTPVSYPIWRYQGNNSRAMMKGHDNQIGALPFTVVRIGKCAQQKALVGEIDGAKIDAAIAQLRKQCR